MAYTITPAPGTISIAHDSAAITGSGTIFTAYRKGFLLLVPGKGIIGQLAETPTDDEAAVLVDVLGGEDDITDAAYQIIAISDPATYTERVRQLIEQISGLPGIVNAIGTFAERSGFDGQATPYIYLSTDGDGDEETGWVAFAKLSDTSGDWDAGQPIGRGEKGDTGDTGDPGPQGDPGEQGPPGSQILTGSGAPDDADGADADFYLNTANGDYYQKADGSWGSVVGNLTGPQGEQGETGATGSTGAAGDDGALWFQGSADPDGGTGSNGDFYLQTGTGATGILGDVWTKAAGSWAIISNIRGASGSGTGDVVGPDGGVADGELALYSGTTGKLIEGSGKAVTDFATAAQGAAADSAVQPGDLGDSALLDVGTTAGTVAAGDDSRITGAEQTANKNVANGYAGLDGSGKVAAAQLPSPGSTDAVPEGSTNLYFTAQRVRDAVLTGLSTATNAVITATDSVLSALGKLQKQVSDLTTSVASTYLTIANPSATGSLKISGNSGSPNIEVGRQDGASSTPYVDFHSGATVTDYDSRIIASGGDGTAGHGTLQVIATTFALPSGTTVGGTTVATTATALAAANNLSDVDSAVTARGNLKILTMTQSAYNALGTKDSDTLYFISG